MKKLDDTLITDLLDELQSLCERRSELNLKIREAVKDREYIEIGKRKNGKKIYRTIYTPLENALIIEKRIINKRINEIKEEEFIKLRKMLFSKYKVASKEKDSETIIIIASLLEKIEALYVIPRKEKVKKEFTKKIKKEKRKKEKKHKEVEYFEISDDDLELSLKILDDDFTDVSKEKLHFMFKYFMTQSIEEKEEVLNKILNNLLDNFDINDLEDLRFLRIYVKDFMNNYEIDESLKQYLKSVHKRLLAIKRIYSKPVEENTYLTDVFKSLIDDEECFIFVQKLMDKKFLNDIVNLRDKDNTHIIFYILEKLFESCIIELIDQTKDFVDKSHYKKVFDLYCELNLDLTSEEQQALVSKIEEFKQYVLDKKYKKGPEVLKILADKEEKEHIEEPIHDLYFSMANRTLLNEKLTFILDEDNKAYSISKVEDMYVVKVHVLDMAAHINDGSDLDKYLKSMAAEPKFNSKSLQKKKFEVGMHQAALTFEIILNKEGKVIGHKEYESIVKIDEDLKDNFTYQNLQQTELHKMIFNCYLLVKKQNKNIKLEDFLENYIEKIISNIVHNHFDDKRKTMIYHIEDDKNLKLYYTVMTEINWLLGKINPVDAKIIHDTLVEEINYSYYGTKPRNKKVDHRIELFEPITNYARLVMQRLIKESFINNRNLDEYDKAEVEKVIKLIVDK